LALHRELDAVMKEAKSRAAKASTPGDLWQLEDYLARSRKAIDDKYDYRYSRLIVVLAVLVREGQISEDDLSGLSEDKIHRILAIANF